MAKEKKDIPDYMMATPEGEILTKAGYEVVGRMDIRRFGQYLTQTNDETAALAMFKIYWDSKPTEPAEKKDSTKDLLTEILNADKRLKDANLGRSGYKITRSKGRGGDGSIIVQKIE